MPTFWGPRAPDQVLADGNFLRAIALTDKNDSQHQIFKHLMHRVDWLRDIRGTDYYDRLSYMIKEWAQLGMVLPVANVPDGVSMQDLHVEQGRRKLDGSPIDDKQDPKFHATEDIENLFEDAQVGLLRAPIKLRPRTSAPPPKRTYRQGKI